jgi:predicted O-methyltransferase YrrM
MANPGPDLVKSELARNGHKGTLVFANGDSHVILPQLFAQRPQLRFDLITVDGDHSAEGAYRDLCDVAPQLQPGGVLVFDDISHPAHPYLIAVWRKFIAEHPYLSSHEYSQQGYGVAFAIRTT